MKSRPEAPSVSAAARAEGTMHVPGCVSMRNVSSFPPASTISALAKAAPAFVALRPVHQEGGAVRHARLLLCDEPDGLLGGGQVGAEQRGREGVQGQSLGAVDDLRRQVLVSAGRRPTSRTAG